MKGIKAKVRANEIMTQILRLGISEVKKKLRCFHDDSAILTEDALREV